MASFPVYRAYPDAQGGSPQDAAYFAQSLAAARERRPDLLAELNYLESLTHYSGQSPAAQAAPPDHAARSQQLIFLTRLMQFTGPLAAKGIEDTTFYVYNPFLAHCEVGDTPAIAGITPEDFHRHMQDRKQKQPHSLNATTTHDTKRGEDSRIRLSFLSALPQEWINAVNRWRQLNQPLIALVKGRPAPSPNDEYLIYQALLGGFPTHGIVDSVGPAAHLSLGRTSDFRGRFSGYLTKALREAKTETNYDDPDEAYEQACQAFAAALLKTGSPFLEDFAPFAHSIIRRSAVYSLSLLLLKLTAPGIPDIYQGAELWEESFVDPDNRRPVDFSRRTTLLRELRSAETQGNEALFDFLRTHRDEGVEKLFTLYRTLAFRNAHPEVFREGAYIPLPCEAPWLAFLRQHAGQWALVAVPLIRHGVTTLQPLSLQLPAEAPTQWTDCFTRQPIRAEASGESLAATQASPNATHAGRSISQASPNVTHAGRSVTQTSPSATQAGPAITLSWPDGPGAWPVILLVNSSQ